jgi:hypothetical protein
MDVKQINDARPFAIVVLGGALIVAIWVGAEWLRDPFEREALFHVRRVASAAALVCLAMGLLYHRSAVRLRVFVGASMFLLAVSIVLELLS